MAKITTGPIIAEIRGMCGDVVFSRNRGGAFSRSKITRVDPWSSLQNDIRAYSEIVGRRWNAVLTETQRTQWRALAATLQRTDQLRQTISLTGHQVFFQRNLALYWWHSTFLDNAPPPQPPLITTPVIVTTAQATPASLILTFARNPAANESFCVTCSKPQNVGRYSPGSLMGYLNFVDETNMPPVNCTANYATYRGTLVVAKKLFFTVRSLDQRTAEFSGPLLTTCIIS